MSEDKTFSFLKGILVGAIAGAVAGVLLAPKSGTETREDLKKLAVDFGEKANELYKKATDILKEKLEQLEKAGKQIDQEKYMELVSQVVNEIKKEGHRLSQTPHPKHFAKSTESIPSSIRLASK